MYLDCDGDGWHARGSPRLTFIAIEYMHGEAPTLCVKASSEVEGGRERACDHGNQSLLGCAAFMFDSRSFPFM